MSTRIYLVTNGASDPRLVRAGTPAQAIRHVTKPIYAAEVASQDQLVAWLGKGTKVEDAKDDAE
jgi:hypothetical protein